MTVLSFLGMKIMVLVAPIKIAEVEAIRTANFAICSPAFAKAKIGIIIKLTGTCRAGQRSMNISQLESIIKKLVNLNS